jgi:oxygen-independent coproporphyrinogen-3 oxidase
MELAPALSTSSPLPLHPEQLAPAVVPGLYVHIPFCFHKCHYCDFYSITRQTPDRMSRFVDLMFAEADQWTARRAAPSVIPQTVFFGGGTPSLLPLDSMRRLIEGLHARFNLAACHEWTVEVNPATADRDYCRMLKSLGVTRLSFGGQSFDKAELALLERHHDPVDVPRSIALAREAGFQHLNVDLIYAIPGQSLASYQRSLEQALSLDTKHLSCYELTYEPNTPLTVRKRLGQFRAAEESVALDMMRHTRRRLAEAGFSAYEISNYAVSGEACRHNLLYWNGGDYIGLGPSAASHVQGVRWRNRPHLGEWEQTVAAGVLPAVEVERLDPAARAGELAMLRLRLSTGIDIAEFADRARCDVRAVWGDLIGKLAAAGLLVDTGRSIHLSERGIEVADAIASEFLGTAADVALRSQLPIISA